MNSLRHWLAGLCLMSVALMLVGCATTPSTSVGQPLRVGTSADYPPVVYMEGEDVLGIEVDFSAMVGDHLGRPVELVRLPFDGLIDKLVAGEIDVIMSGMTATPERAKRVAFAEPYMTVTLAAMVRAEEAGQYLNDLDVKKAPVRVAAQPATTAANFMKTYCFGAKEKLHVDPVEAPAALLRGEIDVYLHDSPAIDWLVSANTNTLAGVKVGLMRQDLAWAVRQSDRALLRALNRMIKDARKDGSLQAPLQRWVPIELGEEAAAKAAGLTKSILFLQFAGPDALIGKTADVSVDGELVRQWELKDKVWLATYLAPGERQVRVTVEGFAPLEKAVTLPAGRALWETLTLTPAVMDEK